MFPNSHPRRLVTVSAVLFLVAAPALLAQEDARGREAGAETATQFVHLFFGKRATTGDVVGELQSMLDDAMRKAFPPENVGLTLAQLKGQVGEMKEIGSAWYEDHVEPYDRYRVPVRFEQATLDARVVLDQSGKVAGLFFVPSIARPKGSPIHPDDALHA